MWGGRRAKPGGARWPGAGTGVEDKLQAPWMELLRTRQVQPRNVCSSLPLNKYLYIHLPAGARTWLFTSRPE